jgi:hypothetical protein
MVAFPRLEGVQNEQEETQLQTANPDKSRNSVDLWDDGRLILRFPAHQAHTPLDLRVLGERCIVVGGG